MVGVPSHLTPPYGSDPFGMGSLAPLQDSGPFGMGSLAPLQDSCPSGMGSLAPLGTRMMRVAILTVSDSRASSGGSDASGDAIAEWIAERGYTLAARATVPDDTVPIAATIARWCDEATADLVVTTGGTGLAPRDVTPEATRAILEREAPGISEAIRAAGRDTVPTAALSRGVAGSRGATLVVNLPGSTGGVTDGLQVLDPLVEHAVRLLAGHTEH